MRLDYLLWNKNSTFSSSYSVVVSFLKTFDSLLNSQGFQSVIASYSKLLI